MQSTASELARRSRRSIGLIWRSWRSDYVGRRFVPALGAWSYGHTHRQCPATWWDAALRFISAAL